jgi:hypothetical protein
MRGEEHRKAKQKAQQGSDMGSAGDTAEEEKEFSEEGAIWARKLDGAAIDKKEKILYVLEFKRQLIKEKGTRKEFRVEQRSSTRT